MANLTQRTHDKIYQICIPNTYHDFFCYYDPSFELCIGARVWVPFRKKTCLGIVIGYGQPSSVPFDKLKPILSLVDKQPLMTESLLALCQWVSMYYQTPLSEVLPLALPKRYRLGKPVTLPMTAYYTLILPPTQAHRQLSARAHRQHALIDYFVAVGGGQVESYILQANFTRAQLKSLCDQKVIACEEKPAVLQRRIVTERASSREGEGGEVVSGLSAPSLSTSNVSLKPEQAVAVQTLLEGLGRYHCFLLYGVTGSGKTEVYLQVIAKVLAARKQVLILVPEIGLTPQLLARFSARFQEPIATIHSHLNESERQQAWQLASDNKIQLVIGTRTAVFTPMPALGLIILDEEHDSSYKQTDGVHYSAHDTALIRASREDIPIILGSATPSLESFYNSLTEKYTLLRLNQKATESQPLHYRVVDTRHLRLEEGLAKQTLSIMEEHLQQGNQVLVFINRRGFAPLLLCHQCGWIADCVACDSHCTVHRWKGALICHHCGLSKPVPKNCQACQSTRLLPIGSGTQRVYEYLQKRFPMIKSLRMDRDEVSRKHAFDDRLEQIYRGEVQLIVGTQMLAKGHHFPKLTLVVILDTETGFYNQDFRALERLGQLLTQVAGRAGREEAAGQVVIQTYLPHHPALNLLVQKGYDAFARQLLAQRQAAQLPPFYFLALIRAQHHSAANVSAFLNQLKVFLTSYPLIVLGPAPAPLTRKAHQHRMQLLLKSSSRPVLNQALTALRSWYVNCKPKQNIQWTIDVDPIDLS